MRTVITMRDGMMVRCEEFLDRGLVEAFMRLAKHREDTNQIVQPPAIPRPRPRADEGRALRMSTKVPGVDSAKVPDEESN
jgi:hypothetical protein